MIKTNSARRRFVFLNRDGSLQKGIGSPSTGSSVRLQSKLKFTALSTLSLLLGVGFTCALLWIVIASTIGI
jgi:hypothetical protein